VQLCGQGAHLLGVWVARQGQLMCITSSTAGIMTDRHAGRWFRCKCMPCIHKQRRRCGCRHGAPAGCGDVRCRHDVSNCSALMSLAVHSAMIDRPCLLLPEAALFPSPALLSHMDVSSAWRQGCMLPACRVPCCGAAVSVHTVALRRRVLRCRIVIPLCTPPAVPAVVAGRMLGH